MKNRDSHVDYDIINLYPSSFEGSNANDRMLNKLQKRLLDKNYGEPMGLRFIEPSRRFNRVSTDNNITPTVHNPNRTISPPSYTEFIN